MYVTFLGASLPLTKTIVFRGGQYSVAPYPHVSRVTSYDEKAGSLDDFYKHLRAHADAGRCLFNGQLAQPLVNESRASKTLKGEPRQWVVFDFDKVSAGSAEEVVQKYLPACCQGVSYIVQHSASMFRPDEKRFSGHLFMLLKEACHEEQLTRWFETVNFTVPALADQLSLSSSGIALHWPLDRTAAYSSRITYIASPRCAGFEPAISSKDAIKIVKKRISHLAIPKFEPISKAQIDVRINELRDLAGLPRRDFTTKKFRDDEVLIGAEPGTITDVRSMGDHYIKFNLNGGDSLGYWIDLRNPAIIRNFKGEPNLKTEEVDEKFFKTLAGIAPRVVSKPAPEEGAEVLAFYATNQGAQMKTGMFLPGSRQLRLDDSSESAATAWLASYGLLKRGPFEHYDLEFNPHSDIQFVPGSGVINTFRATNFMVAPKSKAAPSTLGEMPRVIDKTIRSMMGDPTKEQLGHFINWLAYIFQTRKKAQTAWILHGEEGSGKNTFIDYVLRPLFGAPVVKTVQYPQIQKEFNDFLDGSLFVIVNEASMRAVENAEDVMAKIYHWITDPFISIEGKNKKLREIENFSNFIFITNKNDPVVIANKQRRFNVANKQKARLFYTPNERLSIERGDELKDFGDMLQRWPVNEEQVRLLVASEDAETIHESTTNIGQLTAERLLAGDLQYFIDRMPSEAEAMSDFGTRFNPLSMYKALVDAAIAGKKRIVRYEDLFVLFRTLIPDTRYFQESKSWRLRYFKGLGLVEKPIHNPLTKATDRGIAIDWQIPAGLKPEPKTKTKNKVTDFIPRRRAQ